MSFALEQFDYLPSIKHVLNHDIMNCTAEGVAGNHLYSGRALGISEPWDLIQLHPDLKPLWQDICNHYERIGLQHSKKVIWFLNRKQLGAHIGYQPSVFFYGPHESQYWGDVEWLNTVEFINSKNNFIRLANELDVDIPYTLYFDSVKDIGPATLQKMSYPCYLKAAVSVAGVGIYRCENLHELALAMQKFGAGTAVQVQEEVMSDTFLNLQYQVVGDEPVRLAASEQLLDGFVHQGNRVPASHEPWDEVEAMAYWLVEQGIKGIFAFDVAVAQTAHGLRFPAIECNPRYNGASYPTLIAQKLNIPEWSAITYDTSHRSLGNIDLDGIEYNSSTGEGAIIVNWGTVLVGKLSILLAGSSHYQQALAIELESRLC